MVYRRLPPPRRVVVLRALQLGDLLCAVPALRAFRSAWPGTEMVLIALPWARTFVERFDRYLDGFRESPVYPGLPARVPAIGEIPGFLAAIQAGRLDLAVQLHGSGSIVNPLVMLLGAARGRVLPIRRAVPQPGDVSPVAGARAGDPPAAGLDRVPKPAGGW
jgi:hypothetical protein